MHSDIELIPVSHALEFAHQPLSWSIQLWGQGKEEFSSQDWRDFYQRSKSSNYQNWDPNGNDQELLFMAIREINEVKEVVASIALCDFDDLEEFRKFKPWVAAFIVREDLRGQGIGEKVLKLVERKAINYAITNATVFKAPGDPGSKATILIKDGVILGVGATLALPKEAKIIAGDSLFVYPGFIDGAGNMGITKPKDVERPKDFVSSNPPLS